MTRDVFISHAGDDASVAVEVCALLEKRGLKCWMAPRDVDAGSVWDEAILDAIETSRVFLLILSRSANDSQFVKNEVNRAFSQRKPIVTFRLEDVVPGRSLELYLARHHWTDAFPPPMGARVERLAASITALLNSAPAAAGFPGGSGDSRLNARSSGAASATLPASANAASSPLFTKLRTLADGGLTFLRKPFTLGASAALLGILVGGIAIWNWKPAPLDAPKVVTRFAIPPPPGTQLVSSQNAILESVAISPDGTRIVFAARQGGSTRIYLREVDTLESRAISGSEGGVAPFFSPDGQWVGFLALPGNVLMKAPVNGGPAVTIGTARGNGLLQWTSHGTILFGGFFSPLQKIPATGGDAETIGAIEKGEAGEFDPFLLPDGKNVVFVSNVGSGTGGTNIDIRLLATGERHDLNALSGLSPHYVGPGYIVYATTGNLLAAPFDLKRLAVTGNPVPVVQGILVNITSGANFDISRTGTLVYVPGAYVAPLKMVWVDRKGVEQSINAPPHNYVLPRISPDGQRATVGIEEGDDQIWTYDFGRDTLTRVTFQGKSNVDPIWTPDGKRIVFKAAGNRLFWQPADGSGTMEELTNSPLGTNNVPGSWSPDGQNMAFTYDGGGGPRQIWILPLKDRKPFRLAVNSTSYETSPRFSPDGRWMAYASTETGRSEVYIRPYPGPGGKWEISTDGGTEPVWNPKGRELFFRNGKKMMLVEYDGQQSFIAGKPKELFEGNYIPTPRTFPDYDISPDGQKFLMLKTAEDQQSNSQINVVVNWVEELKQKVPLGKK